MSKALILETYRIGFMFPTPPVTKELMPEEHEVISNFAPFLDAAGRAFCSLVSKNVEDDFSCRNS